MNIIYTEIQKGCLILFYRGYISLKIRVNINKFLCPMNTTAVKAKIRFNKVTKLKLFFNLIFRLIILNITNTFKGDNIRKVLPNKVGSTNIVVSPKTVPLILYKNICINTI